MCHHNDYLLTVVPDSSTGIPEATIYTGQVFYERNNLMRFTAAKDSNALRKVKVLDKHLYPCNYFYPYSTLKMNIAIQRSISTLHLNLILHLDMLN